MFLTVLFHIADVTPVLLLQLTFLPSRYDSSQMYGCNLHSEWLLYCSTETCYYSRRRLYCLKTVGVCKKETLDNVRCIWTELLTKICLVGALPTWKRRSFCCCCLLSTYSELKRICIMYYIRNVQDIQYVFFSGKKLRVSYGSEFGISNPVISSI